MSETSWRVGRGIARRIIARADDDMCGPKSKRQWNTNDLADFVEGLMEGSFDAIVKLRPENVCEVHAKGHSH